MTLVSTIGFFYTHHLVALSRNHFRHFIFQKLKWQPLDKQNWQQRRRSRKLNWLPYGSYGRDGRTHVSLYFGNNTATLSRPSGGHLVCLMTAILVYRLSKIMFASHRGVYMKILHDCYQNHECASLLLKIIIFFGFPSWILPTMQCLMYFTTTHYVGQTRKPYGRHQNYAFLSFLSKMVVIYIA